MALRGIQEYIAWDANNIAKKKRVRSSRMRTVEPLLWGPLFCIRKVALQEGWPLVRGKNQYIYV